MSYDKSKTEFTEFIEEKKQLISKEANSIQNCINDSVIEVHNANPFFSIESFSNKVIESHKKDINEDSKENYIEDNTEGYTEGNPESQGKSQVMRGTIGPKERALQVENSDELNLDEEYNAEAETTSGRSFIKILSSVVALAVILAALIYTVPKFLASRTGESGNASSGAISEGSATPESPSNGNSSEGVNAGIANPLDLTGDETILQASIDAYSPLASNIDKIEVFYDLKFTEDREYGIDGLRNAILFEDDLWYMSDLMENIHYTPELVRTIIEYYAAKDQTKLELLQIGEIRRSNDDFYILVRPVEKNGDSASETTGEETSQDLDLQDLDNIKTIHIAAGQKTMNIVEVVDAVKKQQ